MQICIYRRLLKGLALFVLCLFCLAGRVFAAPGALDPTFAGGGITPSLGVNHFSASSVAVQADGKIIVGGVYMPSIKQPFINAQFALIRYLPTGLLDPDFGTGGWLVTSFNEYQASYMALNDIAVLADGKIVAVGSGRVPNPQNPLINRTNLFVVRYNPNGSLDATFNNTGKFSSTAGGVTTSGEAAAALPDGKFVVAGYSGGAVKSTVPYKFLLFKFSGAGLDNTFGSQGMVFTEYPGGNAQAYAVAVQADGKIIAGGIADNGSVFGLNLARYDTSGSLDTGFGNNGFASAVDFGEANDVLIQPDGKIVAIGSSNFSNNRDFAVLRFNSDGSSDNGFGTNGKVVTAVSNISDVALGGALQADGKIIVAGYSFNANTVSNFNPALVRYNTNGSTDNGFGTAGIVSTPAGFSLSDAAVSTGGKILAASRNESVGSDKGFRLIRYLGDAPSAARRTDFDFDGDGWADFAGVRDTNGNLTWFVTENPSMEILAETASGTSADKIAPADFDGDRKTDIAVFRHSAGTWHILKSATNTISIITLGQNGDRPVPADYDGDGKADAAVFRSGEWFVLNSGDGSLRHERFGISSDKPVIGDFDGDGKSDPTVYRNGFWYQFRSSQGVHLERFGTRFDKPVPADYDGDGKTDAAVFRPLEGTWHLKRSTEGLRTVHFGTATDQLVPADYDGDGKTDIAIKRDFNWYLQQSSSGFRAVRFGHATDTPVHSAFLP